jgi:hypothetical protein
VAFKYIV